MNSTTEEKIEEMKRYLFGELDEAATAVFEQRLFTDSDFFYNLKELENTLADNYAAGRLSPAESRKLEETLTKNSVLREKIANARALQNFLAADGETIAMESRQPRKIVSSDEKTFFQKIFGMFGFSNPVPALAMAALLLLFAGLSIFFFYQNQRLADELTRLKTDAATANFEQAANLERQIAQSNERESELKKRLETELGQSETLTAQLAKEQAEKEKLRRELENLQKQPDKPVSPSPKANDAAPATARVDYASLLPTLVRGGSEADRNNAAKTVIVRPEAEQVVFNLTLPAGFPEQSYNLSLDGQLLSAAKPRTNGTGRKTIRITLDRKKLGDGIHTFSVGQTDYIFRLKSN